MYDDIPKSVYIDILTEQEYLSKFCDKTRADIINCSTKISLFGCAAGYPVISVISSIKPYTYLRETMIAPFCEFAEQNEYIVERAFEVSESHGYYIMKDTIPRYFYDKLLKHKEYKIVIFSAEKGPLTIDIIKKLSLMDIYYNTNHTSEDEYIIESLGVKPFSISYNSHTDQLLFRNLLAQ